MWDLVTETKHTWHQCGMLCHAVRIIAGKHCNNEFCALIKSDHGLAESDNGP